MANGELHYSILHTVECIYIHGRLSDNDPVCFSHIQYTNTLLLDFYFFYVPNTFSHKAANDHATYISLKF